MSFSLSSVLAAANPASTTSSAATTGLNQNYNDFLTMLTTELQNQDPTQPMDSTQFTSQLAQFSGVEQQIQSNTYLQQLLTLGSATNLTTTGLSYVGLNVQAPGSSFSFDGTDAVPLSYNMSAAGAAGTLSIVNSNGTTVFSTTPTLTQGQQNFTWNGEDNNGNAVPAGTYTISVGAQDAQQKPISVTTYIPSAVTGVETASDGTVNLMLSNGTTTPVTSVTQATLPGTVASVPAGANSGTGS